MVSNRLLVCLSSVFVFSTSSLAQAQTTASCGGIPKQCNQSYTINPSGFSYELSPFWDTVVSVGGDHADIDNACGTFLPVGDNCFMYFRSVTFNDGTVLVKKEIFVPLPDPGATRGLGVQLPTGCDSCVSDDFILAQPYRDSYMLYRCYYYGTCVPQFGEQDQLFGFSRTRDVSAEALQALIAFFDANDNQYVVMPNRLPSACVAYVGSAPVLGVDRIPCEYRITVP